MATSTNSSLSVPQNGVFEEWKELESDPGVFSLLIEDYGVRGVKVEEIYDLSTKIETKVYGFVFLFRYILGDRRARKAARDLISEDTYVYDTDMVNNMFFAHQVINNSCATHALLSVLLNCEDVELGPNLTRLKKFSKGLDPESKGLAISNMPELSHAHNKHAKPSQMMASPLVSSRRGSVVSSAHALLPETYHFVSFVPLSGRLIELDGLKELPIDHGPWGEMEEWTDLFQRVVSERLARSPDCLFNLMAVVPDMIPEISEQLKSLQRKRDEVLEQAIRLAEQFAEEEVQHLSSGVPVKPDEETGKTGQSDSTKEEGSDVKSQNNIQDGAEEPLNKPEKDHSETCVGSAVTGDGSAVTGDGSAVTGDGSALTGDGSAVTGDGSAVTGDGSAVTGDGSAVTGDGSAVTSDGSADKEAVTQQVKYKLLMKVKKEEMREVPDILEEVSRTLPVDSEQLNEIASEELEENAVVEKRLRIATAKVVVRTKEVEALKHKLRDELETKQRYHVEHSRRTHNYDPLITEFIKMLAHNNQLPNRLIKRPSNAQSIAGQKRKGNNKSDKVANGKKVKTTLLVNGTKVN